MNDGDSNLLDPTIALYGSGLSYGNSYGTTSLPLVLKGGGGLVRSMGRINNQQVKDFKGYGQCIGVYHSP